MNQCLAAFACFTPLAARAVCRQDAAPRPSHKQQHARKTHEAKEARPHRHAALGKRRHERHADAARKSKRSKDESPRKEATPPLSGDLALVKDAIDLARKAKTDDATATRNKIADPAGQKLVEWFILRHSETTANFNRYAAFIAANPDWPRAALLRRRGGGAGLAGARGAGPPARRCRSCPPRPAKGSEQRARARR